MTAANKAVFVDRDGTLNVYRGFIARPDQIELLPGVSDGIKRLHDLGYLIVAITNQPVVARGDTTFEGLKAIHDRLEELLRAEGASLDAIYFCPHHPDQGQPGEVAELKIDCDCRKPKTGLVMRAAEEMDIDLTRSWMIGDTSRDILMANRAGLRSIQVRTGEGAGQDRKYDAQPDYICEDFAQAAGVIVTCASY